MTTGGGYLGGQEWASYCQRILLRPLIGKGTKLALDIPLINSH